MIVITETISSGLPCKYVDTKVKTYRKEEEKGEREIVRDAHTPTHTRK